jgi:hypothetical protein
MNENKGDIPIKDVLNELLETSIFKNIARRNDKRFAEKLAVWLIRYILVISSMKESLHIDLETVLLNIHGDTFKKIIEITERTFRISDDSTGNYDSYIW